MRIVSNSSLPKSLLTEAPIMRAVHLASTLLAVILVTEFVVGAAFTGQSRSVASIDEVPLVADWVAGYRSVGTPVSDQLAASLVASAVCKTWEPVTDGCENSSFSTSCPDDFNAYYWNETFGEYSLQKSMGQRECSGLLGIDRTADEEAYEFAKESTREGACVEQMAIDLEGCATS